MKNASYYREYTQEIIHQKGVDIIDDISSKISDACENGIFYIYLKYNEYDQDIYNYLTSKGFALTTYGDHTKPELKIQWD